MAIDQTDYDYHTPNIDRARELMVEHAVEPVKTALKAARLENLLENRGFAEVTRELLDAGMSQGEIETRVAEIVTAWLSEQPEVPEWAQPE